MSALLSRLFSSRRVGAQTCDECRFDNRDWRVRDAGSLLGALGEWWRLATDGIADEDLNRRPASGGWSPLEYGLHSALVLGSLRTGIEALLAENGAALSAQPPGGGPGDEPSDLEGTSVIADVEREGNALAALTRDGAAEAWRHAGSIDGERLVAEEALFHAVHDASHHMMDVGHGLAALGVGAAPHSGVVAQINASEGGVPKRPVAGGTITTSGLVGDRQADQKHHGRPFQALCLWSAEVIDTLATEGHPIEAGAAGENLTLRGVDWSQLRPGVQLRLGSAVAELSFPAVPCGKQSRWFTDGDFSRLHHGRHPEWTRWYAWVRHPGEVRPGSPAEVQPVFAA